MQLFAGKEALEIDPDVLQELVAVSISVSNAPEDEDGSRFAEDMLNSVGELIRNKTMAIMAAVKLFKFFLEVCLFLLKNRSWMFFCKMIEHVSWAHYLKRNRVCFAMPQFRDEATLCALSNDTNARLQLHNQGLSNHTCENPGLGMVLVKSADLTCTVFLLRQ